MIGAILSMHYVGKKNWMQSLIFWIVYLVAGAIVTGILYTAIPSLSTFGLVISAAIFITLAMKWYHFDFWNSVKLFAVAVVIDIVIAFILITILMISLPGFIDALMPAAGLL